MAITKDQVSNIKSCVSRLIECELNFERVGRELNQARQALEYQYIEAQKSINKPVMTPAIEVPDIPF